jgi:hypothetical protein
MVAETKGGFVGFEDSQFLVAERERIPDRTIDAQLGNEV